MTFKCSDLHTFLDLDPGYYFLEVFNNKFYFFTKEGFCNIYFLSF